MEKPAGIVSRDPNLVSIIIPVFNGSNYLAEAIESALAQTWPYCEVIVVNDGSTDDTERIALSYGDGIRYFSKENGGQSSALNHGIKNMHGSYFSWLSHDDLYSPDKVTSQMKVAQGRQDVILYTDWMNIDKDGKELNIIQIPPTFSQTFRYELLTRNLVHGCSMLVPYRAFQQYGVFDASIPLTSDVDLWFRLAEHFAYEHIPEVLVKGRVHGKQVSVKKYRQHQIESDRYYAQSLEQLTPTELLEGSKTNDLTLAYRSLARNFSNRGYKRTASKALRYMRTYKKGYWYLFFEPFSCWLLLQKKNMKMLVRKYLYRLGIRE